VTSTGQLRVELFDAAGNRNALQSTAAIPAGTYTHIVATWDGAAIRIYINGKLDSQATTSIASIRASSADLSIGRVNTSFFKGQIDELAFYNRALRQADVSADFAAGSAGEAVLGSYSRTMTISVSDGVPPAAMPSGAVGSWNGDGNTSDSSGNGNNGS